jgi:hypothetical protein
MVDREEQVRQFFAKGGVGYWYPPHHHVTEGGIRITYNARPVARPGKPVGATIHDSLPMQEEFFVESAL